MACKIIVDFAKGDVVRETGFFPFAVAFHIARLCSIACFAKRFEIKLSPVTMKALKFMNGEKNNYWLNGGVALAIGLILSSMIFGWFFAKSRKGDEAITVTGSAKKRIKSDLVVWSAEISYQAGQINEAYSRISGDIPKVKQYLIGKGIADAQITVSSISTTTLKRMNENGVETSEISGYILRQRLEIRSNEVDKVAQIAREATELINQGILIESNAPQYFYTQLGDLKIEMLGEAARDAKTRAERIAASRFGMAMAATIGKNKMPITFKTIPAMAKPFPPYSRGLLFDFLSATMPSTRPTGAVSKHPISPKIIEVKAIPIFCFEGV